MNEFTVRSDSVDVEQIMRQIRARIREKRGVDYTEAEIRELASVKLEKFLDPKNVRSDLLEHYRRTRSATPTIHNYTFDDTTIYESSRGPAGRVIFFIRKLLNPILKLFFNPNPIIRVLHLQGKINEQMARREELDALNYEVLNNIVVEMTRLSIEVKNLKMRVESIGSRLDFDERRARALEGAVQYRPGALAGSGRAGSGAPAETGERQAADVQERAERTARRRRRRGRRRLPGTTEEPPREAGSEAGAGPPGEAEGENRLRARDDDGGAES
jgi:hypothetical protein